MELEKRLQASNIMGMYHEHGHTREWRKAMDSWESMYKDNLVGYFLREVYRR